MMLPDDTIAALASAPGSAARAIVRISGPHTVDVLRHCFASSGAIVLSQSCAPQRLVGRMRVSGFPHGIPVDLCWWPGPRSYTGGPLAELHLPGAGPLVNAVLRGLCEAGARPARSGEFTLRAFLAGRLDLTQAEAVLGVIDADDHVQLRQALTQLSGGLACRIAALREALLLHLADLEAGLDFVEEDIEFVPRQVLRARLAEASVWLTDLAQQAASRMSADGRPQVVLAGLPNAGKSTLFNTLASRRAAIVSPQRGTTRDALQATITLQGITLTLWDTAGWETAADRLQAAAADVRSDLLQRADLVLWCTARHLGREERELDRARRCELPAGTAVIEVTTQCDRAAAEPGPDGGLCVSAVAGTGLEALCHAVSQAVRGQAVHRGELLGTTAVRCREALRRASNALTVALQTLDCGAGDELIALELRSALLALGEVCGAVYTDDILDRVFSRFCIGK